MVIEVARLDHAYDFVDGGMGKGGDFAFAQSLSYSNGCYEAENPSIGRTLLVRPKRIKRSEIVTALISDGVYDNIASWMQLRVSSFAAPFQFAEGINQSLDSSSEMECMIHNIENECPLLKMNYTGTWGPCMNSVATLHIYLSSAIECWQLHIRHFNRR
eukprot:gnl/MRDRNA2_/MRDRNA2_39414_c0_seq1.p1 gnl/MRDRNA2_/MRDRNA2_39414_c0~~gnl/MRDRNA2_/MRDRNA2_39414_c0_seq1.p1  ORF type:complete len:159 (+),score=15.08 gnl/MRDRNA2_/MRDRNA2_39414_c0_seq1:2-478(+)